MRVFDAEVISGAIHGSGVIERRPGAGCKSEVERQIGGQRWIRRRAAREVDVVVVLARRVVALPEGPSASRVRDATRIDDVPSVQRKKGPGTGVWCGCCQG